MFPTRYEMLDFSTETTRRISGSPMPRPVLIRRHVSDSSTLATILAAVSIVLSRTAHETS